MSEIHGIIWVFEIYGTICLRMSTIYGRIWLRVSETHGRIWPRMSEVYGGTGCVCLNGGVERGARTCFTVLADVPWMAAAHVEVEAFAASRPVLARTALTLVYICTKTTPSSIIVIIDKRHRDCTTFATIFTVINHTLLIMIYCIV